MWKNKECDFDELWQLLLHDDIDDPGGNSFIKKDALRLPSGISSQQAVQGAATNLWWESLGLDIKTWEKNTHLAENDWCMAWHREVFIAATTTGALRCITNEHRLKKS